MFSNRGELEYTVRADYENNAEEFWQSFYKDEEAGLLSKNLKKLADPANFSEVRITQEELDYLKSLPGWGEGPAHAPDPLIVTKV